MTLRADGSLRGGLESLAPVTTSRILLTQLRLQLAHRRWGVGIIMSFVIPLSTAADSAALLDLVWAATALLAFGPSPPTKAEYGN